MIKVLDKEISCLVEYGKIKLGLSKEDSIYSVNMILDALHLNDFRYEHIDAIYIKSLKVPDIILEPFGVYAIANKIIEEYELINFYIKLIGFVTPSPSIIIDRFSRIKESKGVQRACDYLYDLSINNFYIQKSAIDKNIYWNAKGKYGLEITINLSKPEKSNKETAMLLFDSAPNYPKCPLCLDNLGFAGSIKQQAKQNLRVIPFKGLNDSTWYMQYSPYVYYNEHCIAFNDSHIPMKVDKNIIAKLFAFIKAFPNYFIGSNAALPIVGGSILNHEHFQGGRHTFPMQRCKVKSQWYSPNKDVSIYQLDWLNNVIRVVAKKKKDVIEVGSHIIETWINYSDENIDLISKTNANHNTCAPILRKDGNKYCLDLILRNNRCNEKYPDGIFHVHPQYHNIKKESIGLIEAMGLFILPGRLLKEIIMMKEYLTGRKAYDAISLDESLQKHKSMLEALIMRYGSNMSEEAADIAIKKYINKAGEDILRCTAIFKDNQIGIKAFKKFMTFVGLRDK